MNYRGKIIEIKKEYLVGKISYSVAREMVEDLLVEMNARAEKIAKKYSKKHRKLTFGYVFR